MDARFTLSSLRLTERPASPRCSWCHDDLAGPGVRCPGCATRLHKGCAARSARCPTLGCGVHLAGLRPLSRRPTEGRRWACYALAAVWAPLALLLGSDVALARTGERAFRRVCTASEPDGTAAPERPHLYLRLGAWPLPDEPPPHEPILPATRPAPTRAEEGPVIVLEPDDEPPGGRVITCYGPLTAEEYLRELQGRILDDPRARPLTAPAPLGPQPLGARFPSRRDRPRPGCLSLREAEAMARLRASSR